jgi:predicted nuclease with TOPRIM domain
MADSVDAAVQVFTTIGRRHEILAEQDAQLHAKEEALTTIEARITAALAYERALTQHVGELEGRWQELCEMIPPAERALQERLQELHGQVAEAEQRLTRLHAAIAKTQRQHEAKEEEYRRLVSRYHGLQAMVENRERMLA